MYGGMATAGYMSSCMELQAVLQAHGIPFTYRFMYNESLITRARNLLCKAFLEVPDATHLLFIDADIEFDPMDVLRMLQADKDVIGCPYHSKTIDWDKVATFVCNNTYTADELSRSGLTGVYNRSVGTETEGVIQEMLEIGTGMMLVKREVLQRMEQTAPDNYILADAPRNMKEDVATRRYYRFFDTQVDGERYLSEDYMFCKRWRELGGSVFLLTDAKTKHWGTYAF
jgi:hypothetical protein